MNRRNQTIAVVFGALLALAVLRVTNILIPFEDMIRFVLSPLGRTATSLGTSLSSSFGRDIPAQECNEALVDLESRLASVSVDYVRLRALEEENEVLRKSLGYLQKQGYDAVMARVISRSAVPNKAVIMIDRGSKDGLEVGMAAIVSDGILVGKVTKIQERTAVVTLFSDPDSRVAISKAGERKLIGLIEGRGNWASEATLIPQQEALEKNDLLVTSGTEEKIPPNLIVGLVNQVIGQPTDPFKKAAIEALVSLEYLEVVAVLRPQALRPD